MNIVKKHLDGNQYYHDKFKKIQIYIHHTVSQTFDSTFNWWNQTPSHVGTAYVIDKDGTIYETFPPEYWSWHLGLNNSTWEKRSIGIELVNEGYLKKIDNNKFYWLDGRDKYTGTPYIHNTEWREQRYWATYPDEQVFALVNLLKHLVEKFDIKKDMITHYNYDETLVKGYEGILSHIHVRKDKTDVSVAFDLPLLKTLTFPEPKPIDVSDMKPIERKKIQ